MIGPHLKVEPVRKIIAWIKEQNKGIIAQWIIVQKKVVSHGLVGL